MRDFGYDVSDYCGVDPMFGTLADFDALLATAHGLGLRVIIDQVWSHTSDEHPWFQESRASRLGPKADWYVWADPKPDGSPPNNWQASFGGPSWTWEPRRRQYYLHNFLSSQPDLNFHDPEVQAAILDVARFWLDRGVDGFRLDVVNYYAHDRALSDNPAAAWARPPSMPRYYQRHLHDVSQPQTLDFVARLRALTDSYGGRIMVGEIDDAEPLARQIEYTDGPHRLHTAYSFFLLTLREASAGAFGEALTAWQGAAGWPSWSLGNHDVPRFPSRMARGAAPDDDQIRVLLAVLLCLRGTPFLYQGDELGLPQATVPRERLRDPLAIASYTGGSGRDGARTPFPWTAGDGAGFSTAASTWLPIDPEHRRRAAELQEGDPRSTLNFVRSFLAMRRSQAALRIGDVTLLPAPGGVLAFERRAGDARTVCLFELDGEAADVRDDFGDLALLASGLPAERTEGRIKLPPYGGALLAGSI